MIIARISLYQSPSSWSMVFPLMMRICVPASRAQETYTMKLTLSIATLIGFAAAAHADEFTGYLADAKCAAAGKAAKAEHADCSRKCVTAGEKIVLVGEDGKVLQIKNQDKVNPHVGHK